MRRLLALLALTMSALLLTPPASAGGPTSVLITDPATGQATGLYYSDAAYTDLDRMVTDGERLDGEPSVLGSRTLNLTWLIHDVQPWKTQQLHLDAEGGPVVATYDELGSGRTTWTRPTEAKALLLLADGLFEQGPGPASDPVASVPDPEPVVVESVTETAWYSVSGWRWLVPGLLLGAGLALVATAVTRGRAREHEPRQVLIDA